MSAIGHFFGLMFAMLLVGPWLVIAAFPLITMLLGLAILSRDFAVPRQKFEDTEEPPPEEYHGSIFGQIRRRKMHKHAQKEDRLHHTLRSTL